ncbi:hypothetical protein VM1G_09599 [Cytospora mali]|uniref:Uncharacterized protein n=1 Tax=Cytospora mali TaxID=578113 RepID=A0A194WCZ9_CYTMA|nr:hypothetical protein VM1G_09599 [Valsa mali]
MDSPIPEAQKAWKHSRRRGEMKWLENATFIPAECFQPAITALPRPWKRIAVPSATVRQGNQKIYKRVVASPYVDTKYKAVIAELDSQGFGGRKRAKTDRYLEAWCWDGLRFDPAYEEEKTGGGYELVRARLQVKRAYKNITEDNKDIIAKLRPAKRSTFPPAQLTWVPRKRHNTRWPITPPQKDAPLLAEFQPLIKFELEAAQVDESAFWEQQNPMDTSESESEPILLAAQQVKKLSSRRLSIAKRPSLSTIAEELKGYSVSPTVTPTRPRHSTYSSPLERWSVGTDRYNTPTKVASSPMKNFTITATPSKIVMNGSDKVEEANEAEVAQLSPVELVTESNEGTSTVEDDNQSVHSRCLSTPIPSHSTATAASNSRPGTVETTKQQVLRRTPLSSHTAPPAAPIAVFDQPPINTPTVPEYETRRRISLDNARRSDRQTDAKILKRVRNWVTNATTINRRHSSSATIQKKPRQSRRHTLDVDVGRNPDIFGQAIQDTQGEIPSTEQKITSEKGFNFIPQATAHLEEVQDETENEEIIPQIEDPSATSPEATVQQVATPSSAVRKYTQIDWDLIKPINERYNHCPTTGSASIPNSDSPTIEAPTTTHLTADDTADIEPRAETSTSHTSLIEDPTADHSAADDPVTDAFTVDAHDDSELALLRNFVRRAQMKPKRRSSATLFTGSPMAKAETTSTPIKSPRIPLGEKDSNQSPSPNKKRKSKDAEDIPPAATTKSSRLVKPDLEDTMPQPQRKKRRKGVEMDCPDDILNPDIDFSQNLTQKGAASCGGGGGGLRRSKRVATSKPTELATPSQIPVRLPGSSGMMADADMPVVSTVGLMQRKTEKDLATLTRTNTRRNKGGAVPVHARLADMVDVADATISDPFCSPGKPTTTIRGGKAVRWDEILFRTQGEDGGAVVAVEEEDNEEDKDDAEEELRPPQMRTMLGRPSNPVGEHLLLKHEDKIVVASGPSPARPQPEDEKKKKALRPRASRLPAAKTPATEKKGNGVTAVTPKRKPAAARSSLPAPPRVAKTAARGTAGSTPASKRTGVLGASLGTPAPKRRGGVKK